MRANYLHWGLLLTLVLPSALLAQTPDRSGGATPPMPLGELIAQADRILVVRVGSKDGKEQEIFLKPVAALKGKAQKGKIYLQSLKDQPDVREWARQDKQAVCFIIRGEQFICLGNRWMVTSDTSPPGGPSEWSAEEAGLDELWLTTYVGPVEQLCAYVRAIQAGRRVVVTARAPERNVFAEGPSPIRRDWRRGQKGRVWRIEAGPPAKRPRPECQAPVFAGWGVGGPEIVPLLLRSLRDRDPLVRSEAIEDLGRLGAVARRACPALRERLRDPDPFVRVYAALALARIDPEARPELATLTAALKAPDASLRVTAVAALIELGSRAEASLDGLMDLVGRDPKPAVRRACAYALGKIGANGNMRKKVVVLSQVLQRDTDEETRFQAIRALARLGSASWEAVPGLRAALLHEKKYHEVHDLSRAATDVLARLDPPPVEVLTEALENPRIPYRGWIAQRLGEMGSKARVAVPALCRLALRGENEWNRLEAAAALVRIEGPAAATTVVPALRALIRAEPGPWENLAPKAIALLAELGPEARAAVPDLVDAVKGDEPLRQMMAIQVLGRIGAGSAEAVKVLRSVRLAKPLMVMVARSLGQLGKHREAAQRLIETLKDERTWWWWKAAYYLGELGPHARSAIPALKKALVLWEKESDFGSLAWALWCVEHPAGADPARRRAAEELIRLHNGAYGPMPCVDSWASNAPEQLAAHQEGKAIEEQAEKQLRLLASEANPVAILTRALKDRRPEVRLVAAVALAYLAPDHKEAPVVLATLLAERFDRLPYLAEALAALGPRARAALPSLREMQRFENPSCYQTATRLLERIDPPSARAFWHIAGPCSGPSGAALTAAAHERLWRDLAADPMHGYLAQCRLLRDGIPAADFLGRHLTPVRAIARERIERFIADLDSDRFAQREQATAELRKVLDQAEPLLRRTLTGGSSPEVRRRIRRLLVGLDPFASAERRRPRRALEILELLDSREARAHLRRLAAGVPEAWLTQEAKASLGRLDRLPSP